jgi:hypothetical protein
MMHARRGLAVCTHHDHGQVEGGLLALLIAASWADLFTT